MTCRYLFSRKEYIRATTLQSWVQLPKTSFWLALLALFFIYLAWSGIQAPDVQAQIPKTEPAHTSFIIWYYLNFLPPVLIPVVLISPPFWCYLNYFLYRRRGTFAGKKLFYQVSDEGILLESDGFRQSHGWSMIGGAYEGKHGFLLFFGKGRKSFHWLPKTEFEMPEDVGRCRELLKRHVTNFH